MEFFSEQNFDISNNNYNDNVSNNNNNNVTYLPLYDLGRYVWILIHTLSIKISDNDFINIRKDFLDIIYYVCVNFACPKCAFHSEEYLTNNKFFDIQSKNDLIYFLFTFHNNVSENLNKDYNLNFPIFLYEDINIRYDNLSIQQLVNDFSKFYTEYNSFVLKGEEEIKYASKWFIDNINYFSSSIDYI